jgi:hypothetical protein
VTILSNDEQSGQNAQSAFQWQTHAWADEQIEKPSEHDEDSSIVQNR